MTSPPLDYAKLREIAEKAKSGLADGAWYRDPRTYWIWAPSLKGGHAHIADIRGWGYLTGGGHGALGLSEEAAIEAQTAWGEHIAAFSPDLVLALLADNARMREVYEAARDVSMAAVQDDDGEWSIKGDPELMLGRLYLATEEVRKAGNPIPTLQDSAFPARAGLGDEAAIDASAGPK